MNSYGEIFRNLRKERGYTLKTMSQDIISFSYLSKFEKGESDITLLNFIRLIERLNMTIDEFLYFNEVNLSYYSELFIKMAAAYAKNNSMLLKSYAQTEENLYNTTDKVHHKCNSVMILAVAQDIDASISIPQDDTIFLVDYIVKCSYWSTYEVSMLGNTLTLFSDDLLLILLEEVKSRLNEYKVTKRNIRDLIALIENACLILLRNKKIEEAKSLSDFLEFFLAPTYFFEKTRKIFIDGIILICKGDINEGTKKSQEAINIIRVMNKELGDDYYIELEFFLNNGPV